MTVRCPAAAMVAIALTAAVLGACGGGSAADRSAWARKVDAACAKAERAAGAHRVPASIKALPPVVSNVAADVRDGIDAVKRVDRPRTVDRQVRGFIDDLTEMRGLLVMLDRAMPLWNPAGIGDEISDLRARAASVRRRAAALGLRRCAHAASRTGALEAVAAVAFSDEWRDFERRVGRSLHAINPTTPSHTPAVARTLATVLEQADADWARLHVPPAVTALADDYHAALHRSARLYAGIAHGFEAGKGATPAWLASAKRAAFAAARRQQRAYVRLSNAVAEAMRPVVPPEPTA